MFIKYAGNEDSVLFLTLLLTSYEIWTSYLTKLGLSIIPGETKQLNQIRSFQTSFFLKETLNDLDIHSKYCNVIKLIDKN